MGIPHLVLLLLISYMMGRGGFGVAFAVAVTHWPELTRLVRAEVLQVRGSQYVKASLRMGHSWFQVARAHSASCVACLSCRTGASVSTCYNA